MALNFLKQKSNCHTVKILDKNGELIGIIYNLEPMGFIVTPLDDEIDPIIAYSFENNLELTNKYGFDFSAFLRKNISSRKNLDLETKQTNESKWSEILTKKAKKSGKVKDDYLIKTHWDQNMPYNKFCPIDSDTGLRSLTGCPTTAMSQIINFHKVLPDYLLTEADKYAQYCSETRIVHFDEDALELDFPIFGDLNNYSEAILEKFKNEEELDQDEMAALNFLCGIVMQQSYGSSVSGTYFHYQVQQGFERLGFAGAQLLLTLLH